MVPFPASYSDDVSLSMMLSDDARIVVVSGPNIPIPTESEFEFVETFEVTSPEAAIVRKLPPH
jgi:hypothetical protein